MGMQLSHHSFIGQKNPSSELHKANLAKDSNSVKFDLGQAE
jgi:hypothetical protein